MCRYLPTQDTLFVEPARLCTDRSSNQPLAPPPPFPLPSVWSSFLWCLWKRQTVVLSSTAAASSIATPTKAMRGNMMMTMMMLVVVTTSSPNSNRVATKALSLSNLSHSSLNLGIHLYKVQPHLGYVAGIFVWLQSEAALEPRMLCGRSGTSSEAFLNGSFKIRGKLRVPRELIRSILNQWRQFAQSMGVHSHMLPLLLQGRPWQVRACPSWVAQSGHIVPFEEVKLVLKDLSNLVGNRLLPLQRHLSWEYPVSMWLCPFDRLSNHLVLW